MPFPYDFSFQFCLSFFKKPKQNQNAPILTRVSTKWRTAVSRAVLSHTQQYNYGFIILPVIFHMSKSQSRQWKCVSPLVTNLNHVISRNFHTEVLSLLCVWASLGWTSGRAFHPSFWLDSERWELPLLVLCSLSCTHPICWQVGRMSPVWYMSLFFFFFWQMGRMHVLAEVIQYSE